MFHFLSTTANTYQEHLVPTQVAQYQQYARIFHEFAGEDGQLERSELQQFFSKYNISVSPERLTGIISEVDDDNSGFPTTPVIRCS